MGIGRQLHVHCGVEAAVGHLHHPRLGIGGADPRLTGPDTLPTLAVACTARRFGLLLLQFRQLRDGLLEPLLLFCRGPFARPPLPRRQRRMRGRIHLRTQLLDMLAGLLKQALEPLFATEAARSRAHSNPHSVLAHTAYPHYLLIHQRGDHLREQPIQSRPVIAAEVRQQAVIHRHSAAQPAEGRAVLGAPRQLARRTDAADAGVQPQPHQKLRIGRVPAGVARARLDGVVEPRQVKLFYHRHHHPYRVARAHRSSGHCTTIAVWLRSGRRKRTPESLLDPSLSLMSCL